MSRYAGHRRHTWAGSQRSGAYFGAAQSRAAWASMTADQRMLLRKEYRHLRRGAPAVIIAGSMRRIVRTLVAS